MSLDVALREWAEILGRDRVLASEEILDRYARTTQAYAHRPVAVVYPESTDEVAAVVRIAARNGVPIYPISTGKNWGMGAAAPVRPGQVVVDLGRMNRVLEVSEDLAYAVLQPGVTQGQLHDHLREHAPGLMMDVTASARDTSLIGNIVDRGDGFTALSDRFANCAGFEVVLGDGTVVETGYAHYGAGCLGHANKWGVGPSLDGLFSQSNLGIVTRLSMWLQPRPEHVVVVALTMADDALSAVVDSLRPLRQRGVIQTPPHIYNALRLAKQSAVPLEGTFSLEEQRRLAKRSFDWLGTFALHGSRAQVRVYKRLVRRALRGSAKVITFSRRTTSWMGGVARLLRCFGLRRLAAFYEVSERGLGVLIDNYSGIPSDAPVRGVASHSKLVGDAEAAPDLLEYDDVGMYWLTHAAPLRGEDARAGSRIIREVMGEYRVPPQLTFTPVSGRTLLLNATIYFDRTSEARRDAAHACQEELSRRLVAAGYPPFRSGIHGMHHLRSDGTFWSVVDRVRQAFDPAGVLAPGRYQPSVSEAREAKTGPVEAEASIRGTARPLR